MIKEKNELIKYLQVTIDNNKHDRAIVYHVKESLGNYGLLKGETQKIFTGVHSIEGLDKSLLCLFTDALFEATHQQMINPIQYFTPDEMNKIKTEASFTPVKNEKINFPIVLDDVIQFTSQDFTTKMDIKEIAKLYNDGLIDYDYRSQRNAKIIKRHGKKYKMPNINKKSVHEIKEKILKGLYFADPITINIILGSNEDSDELTYDETKRKLYINGGLIHILDGFHRLNAFIAAVTENPSIELGIPVQIKNYDIESARKYFGQINTQNPIDPGHLKSLKSERYSDLVTKKISSNSDLRGKVSQSSRINDTESQLVTYSTLSDVIDEEFKLESNKDALELSEYLSEFFDMLIGSFEDEFIHYIKDTKKVSLINHNIMFNGYVVLAKRFKDNNIKISKVDDVLKSIDFNKNNDEWEDIGVLFKGQLTRSAKKRIKEFFEKINLEAM